MKAGFFVFHRVYKCMAIYKFNNNLGTKRGGAVSRAGVSTYIQVYSNLHFSGVYVDQTFWNNRQVNVDQSWGLGTGYQANTTGSLIFNNASGFGLVDATVINRGPNNSYIAFNLTGWDITKAVQLKTDESISLDKTWVENIWVAASTGTCIIDANGMKDSRPY